MVRLLMYACLFLSLNPPGYVMQTLKNELILLTGEGNRIIITALFVVGSFVLMGHFHVAH